LRAATPRCSLGQAGTAEVAAAVVVLQGYISADGASVVCPTPPTSFAPGRLSFNDQQYTAPVASLASETVSFHAIGPLLRMSSKVYHVGESDALLAVDVELVGESVLNVSVMINVSFGGSSVLPGEDEANGYQPVPHAPALSDGDRRSTRDFAVPVRRLSWVPGELGVKKVTVLILNDKIFEIGSEALTLQLYNATNADIVHNESTSTVTITDDDKLLLLAVRPHTPVYRAHKVTHAYIPVDVIGGETALPSKVGYAVGGGTLVSGVQYEPQSGSLEWEPHDQGTKFVKVGPLYKVNSPTHSLEKQPGFNP
jgi:hypothetical protein